MSEPSNRSPSSVAAQGKAQPPPLSIIRGEDEQVDINDPQGKSRNMSVVVWNRVRAWKGAQTFALAQAQVAVVLTIAYIGNNWRETYPRNDNHNMPLFWFMNVAVVVAGALTLSHKPGREGSVQLLSRSQTEEWKGWMQWAFIMYHYYRAYNVYNAIRCFVSAYVWMTGFGNFLYFDKKQDFSVERGVSMWLRINYFPILLCVFIGVPMDLLYIVPLHTTAFFITMATCYLASKLDPSWSSDKRNTVAIVISILAHVIFYETPLVNSLKLISKEIFFRFQSDKYSAVLGILSGYMWHFAQRFITWTHLPNEHGGYSPEQKMAAQAQRIGGVVLIAIWWIFFGSISDKLKYNPLHPYIFWIPIAGWLALRNSSKYLTELHSTALEFFGKITLETYVLQFHVFMCRYVQHIPVVIPGSGKDGPALLKFLNMLLTGVLFVALAYWARQITVTTQTTVTDLVVLLLKGAPPTTIDSEVVALKPSNHDTAGNGHNGTKALQSGEV